jgi:hypothetical protein
MFADPIVWRGMERLMIAVGAIVFGYFGYKLYELGMTKGKTDIGIRSSFFQFAVSGTGPGLVFLTFGATVLVAGIFSGGGGIQQTGKDAKWLYSADSHVCGRLLGSPEALLPGALESSALPWAPVLAHEVRDTKKLRRIVEALCREPTS